ncbi:hypothetical protein ANN_05252 [Periplaneta americana]|uniref:Uncharacterized protein n=1 Tax=Periplaneta americana TaxID=6978 RepID=A0ABQ8TAL9_PERAM|nr:hypothetical protein ANN_05252 [Periplaneta americana]
MVMEKYWDVAWKPKCPEKNPCDACTTALPNTGYEFRVDRDLNPGLLAYKPTLQHRVTPGHVWAAQNDEGRAIVSKHPTIDDDAAMGWERDELVGGSVNGEDKGGSCGRTTVAWLNLTHFIFYSFSMPVCTRTQERGGRVLDKPGKKAGVGVVFGSQGGFRVHRFLSRDRQYRHVLQPPPPRHSYAHICSFSPPPCHFSSTETAGSASVATDDPKSFVKIDEKHICLNKMRRLTAIFQKYSLAHEYVGYASKWKRRSLRSEYRKLPPTQPSLWWDSREKELDAFQNDVNTAIRKIQDNTDGLELNGLHELLVYEDDVNMLGENPETIRENTEILLEASKEIGLELNPEKTKCLRWAGHVARMGESRNAYRVLVGRPEGKRPLGRPRRRWEDNIKMDLREVGYDDRDWINLAQDRDRWRAYVRAAMNLRVS